MQLRCECSCATVPVTCPMLLRFVVVPDMEGTLLLVGDHDHRPNTLRISVVHIVRFCPVQKLWSCKFEPRPKTGSLAVRVARSDHACTTPRLASPSQTRFRTRERERCCRGKKGSPRSNFSSNCHSRAPHIWLMPSHPLPVRTASRLRANVLRFHDRTHVHPWSDSHAD